MPNRTNNPRQGWLTPFQIRPLPPSRVPRRLVALSIAIEGSIREREEPVYYDEV